MAGFLHSIPAAHFVVVGCHHFAEDFRIMELVPLEDHGVTGVADAVRFEEEILAFAQGIDEPFRKFQIQKQSTVGFAHTVFQVCRAVRFPSP